MTQVVLGITESMLLSNAIINQKILEIDYCNDDPYL